MANVTIPELSALTSPSPSDLVPVADVSTANDEVKKTSVGEIVGIITGDVEVATDGTATISELPVSKLQDGAARQLLQTAANGTDVEWTSDVDLPGTLGVTGQSTLTSAAITDLTSGRVVLAGASGELEDSANLVFNGSELGITGTLDLAAGNAYYIGGAETLSATALGSAVVSSSLTSVGTIATGTWEGTAIDAAYLDPTVVTTSDTGTVTSAMILDGTIVNNDINASAAIAGTKIDPDFGSQTIKTTGQLVVGTTNPVSDAVATLSADTDTALFFRRGSGTNQDGAIRLGEGGDFQFLNGANSSTVAGLSERVRINSSGRLLVGTSSSVSGAGNTAVEVVNAGSQGGELVLGRNDTSIEEGNAIGIISFWGNDSDGLYDKCASITALGDDVHSDDSKATRLEFSVTADGSASPTEALRISNDRSITVSDGGDVVFGTTTGTKIGTATSQKIGFYNATPVVQPTAVADITTTATSGSLPTPDGSVTIADAATPTVTELLEYCVELEAKLEAALGHLRTLGLIAT